MEVARGVGVVLVDRSPVPHHCSRNYLWNYLRCCFSSGCVVPTLNEVWGAKGMARACSRVAHEILELVLTLGLAQSGLNLLVLELPTGPERWLEPGESAFSPGEQGTG